MEEELQRSIAVMVVMSPITPPGPAVRERNEKDAPPAKILQLSMQGV
jgi:hypothetical protein